MSRYDIAIIGGGPVGLTVALAMDALGYKTLIAERRPPGTPGEDRRILALSEGSRLILDRLGIWTSLTHITPITRIRVSDRHQVSTAYLSADECHVPALGYVTTFHHLTQILSSQVRSRGALAMRMGTSARVLTTQADSAQVELQGEVCETIEAALVIHAEGGKHEADANDARTRDYEQWAIVCELWTSEPPSQCAYEHFTENGPIALLPFEDHYALIWTLPTSQHDAVLALDDETFVIRLQNEFTSAGRFTDAGPRAGFALSMRMLTRTVEPRAVRIGNAAQQLHPVAAQGFNLGLRDVWELYECLWNTPTDPGMPLPLAVYEHQRAADRTASVRITDSMIGVFGNPHPLVRTSRGAALKALSLIRPLRNGFARHMMFGSR